LKLFAFEPCFSLSFYDEFLTPKGWEGLDSIINSAFIPTWKMNSGRNLKRTIPNPSGQPTFPLEKKTESGGGLQLC